MEPSSLDESALEIVFDFHCKGFRARFCGEGGAKGTRKRFEYGTVQTWITKNILSIEPSSFGRPRTQNVFKHFEYGVVLVGRARARNIYWLPFLTVPSADGLICLKKTFSSSWVPSSIDMYVTVVIWR